MGRNEDFEVPETYEEEDLPEDDGEYYDWEPMCPGDCDICGCHGCIPGCDYYVDEDEYNGEA